MPRTKDYSQRSHGGLPPLITKCMGRERPRGCHLLTPKTDRILRSHTAKSNFLSEPPANSTRSKRRKRSDPWLPKRKPKAQPRPRRSPPTHFTCRICVEEKPTSDFPQWVTVRSWQKRSPLDAPYQCLHHLARNPRKSTSTPVCKSCIGASMSARLDLLGARRLYIGCLEPSCTVPWSDSFIAAYLPTHSTRAWEKFNLEMFESWKLEHPLMTCVSPTCSASGLPDPHAPGYPQVACHTCAFRSCAQCLVPWHADTTCAEHQATLIDKQLSDPERETLKLMHGKDARRCPNCAFVIEKDGGCDSMYCTACHKYFNWQTAASTVLGRERKAATWAMGILEVRGVGSARCEDEQLRRVQGV